MENNKMSKWHQEARCKLIRMGKSRGGGITEWGYWTPGNGIDEKVIATFNDGSFVQLYTCGINGTYMAEGYSLVGGWAQWLPDAMRDVG